MNLIPKLPGIEVAWSAVPFAFLVYVLLLIDARRKDSPSAADDQLGIKTVAATLALVGTLVFALGLRDLLGVLLTFDQFWDRTKVALPPVLVGALGVGGAAFVLFPKTNAKQFPKAKRLAAGIVALISGVAMLPALAGLLTVLLDWPGWDPIAASLALTLDALLLFGASFMVLAKLSGVEMPKAQAGPTAGPPMQPQGYPGQPMQQPGQPQQPQGYPPAGPGQGPGGWSQQ